MGIDLLRTFTEEWATNGHAVFFMSFLVMTEKAAEGRREGLSQAHSLRTYSIVVVKDWRRSVKEHDVAGLYYTWSESRERILPLSLLLLFIQSGAPACGLLQPIPRVDLPSLVKTSLKIYTQTCLECFLGDFQSSQVDDEFNHLFHFLLLSFSILNSTFTGTRQVFLFIVDQPI